jgi:hypothetical protein
MLASRLWIISVLIITLLLPACRQQEPAPAGGIVKANAAYLKAFGQPPAVQSGVAFARVGYLPLQKNPDRVGAVPLYIYEPVEQLPRILRQLVGGVLALPPDSPLFVPFPTDSSIQIVSHAGGALVLSLTAGSGVSADVGPMSIALAETALQYGDVDEVTVLVADRRYGPFVHEPQRIVPPAPPDMVMVAGIWDEGEDDPDEVVINFDRPVTVNSFRLSYKGGEKVAGEYFTSVFQMAVVVHPGNPQRFHEGLELTVKWQVTDALGRVGDGERDILLERFVHEAELGEFPQK